MFQAKVGRDKDFKEALQALRGNQYDVSYEATEIMVLIFVCSRNIYIFDSLLSITSASNSNFKLKLVFELKTFEVISSIAVVKTKQLIAADIRLSIY